MLLHPGEVNSLGIIMAFAVTVIYIKNKGMNLETEELTGKPCDLNADQYQHSQPVVKNRKQTGGQ